MVAGLLVVACVSGSGVPLALSLFAFMKEDGTLATYTGIRCGLAVTLAANLKPTPWVAAAAATRG